MSDRAHAHELIDRLPETQLSALVGPLETIVDPVAVAEARQGLKRNGGRGIPHQEAMRRAG